MSNDREAHRPAKAPPPGPPVRGTARLSFHVGVPPTGSCDVTSPPVSSAATHVRGDAQDTSVSAVCTVAPVSPPYELVST